MFTVQYRKHIIGGVFDRQSEFVRVPFYTWSTAADFAMLLKLTDESHPMQTIGHEFYATDILVVSAEMVTNCKTA